MIRLLLALAVAASLGAPAAALAQSRSQAVITIDKSGPCRAVTTYNPATGNSPQIGCLDTSDRFVMPSGVAIAGETQVESLAALQALPAVQVTAGTRARRRGYAAAGDGGEADYVYSTTACSRNDGEGDGGAQVKPQVGGGCWTIVPSPHGLTPQQFGAKCDGATDDTLALRRLFGAMTSRATVTVSGACAFTGQLTLPLGLVDVFLRGVNGGTLLYTGADTTLDPVIQIGRYGVSGCQGQGWRVENLRLVSNTVMTAGVALQIGHMCRAIFDGLIIGDQNDDGFIGPGNANWHDAVEFVAGNTIAVRDLMARGSGTGIRAHGDMIGALTDITFTGTKAIGSGLGVNVSGNVGGILFDSGGDYLNNALGNVRISQDDVPIANLQVFFGQVPIDGTSGTGVGLDIADPGKSDGGRIIMVGTWLSYAKTQCVLIRSTALRWTIQLTGGQVITCGSGGTLPTAAFDNQSTSPDIHIAISGTIFGRNLGQKNIYNIAGANPIGLVGAHFLDATTGQINGGWSGTVIESTGAVRTASSVGAQIRSYGGSVLITPGAGKYACIGNGGETGVWVGNGAIHPGDGGCSTGGGAMDLGTAAFPFNTARMGALVSIGTKPTWSGCPTSGGVGGAAAGAFTLTAACTGTLGLAFGATPNGWICDLTDITTPAATIRQTGYASGSATFSVAGALSGDKIVYKCVGI